MENKMIRLKVEKLENGAENVQVQIRDALKSQEFGQDIYNHCNVFVNVNLIEDNTHTQYIISKGDLWITMYNKRTVDVIYEN